MPLLAGPASDYSDRRSRRNPIPPATALAQTVPTRRNPMIDLNHIDDIARRLSERVPPGLRESGEELQASFRGVLRSGLARLDLVTREEFEVQRAVLLRTREKLEALEGTVAELEARHQAGRLPTGPG